MDPTSSFPAPHFIAGCILILSIIAIVKAMKAKNLADALRTQVDALERDIRLLRQQAISPPEKPAATEGSAAPAPRKFPEPVRAVPAQKIDPGPPPLSSPIPPAPARVEIDRPASPPVEPDPPIDWEQFMGAKLFAWVGGLALFLGIAFFVRYSFDHNLIPPAARVAIGFATGAALIAGGVLMKRRENVVTAQTLCATGIVVLYAVTYACRSYYHFSFFGPARTLSLMALVTVAAFLLSVRMDALVIAVLGVAGGFLTPILLSTGQDNPLGLFGYVALLDAGLVTIAQRKRWNALPLLGAAGTLAMEASWIIEFFEPGHYYIGNKILVTMAVLAGFQVLFLAAAYWAHRKERTEWTSAIAALAASAAGLLGAFYFLGFQTLGSRPVLLCGYLFLADCGLVALTLFVRRLAFIRNAAGMAAFIFLGTWMQVYLSGGTHLAAALSCCFLFGIFHCAVPLVVQRYQKTPISVWTHLFPVFALLIALMPIYQFNDLSMLIWPFVLLVDLLAFFVAIMAAALAPVIAVLILTVVAIGGAIDQIPPELTGLSFDLSLIAMCGIVFVAASLWATRHLSSTDSESSRVPANLANYLPALSAILPFLLLIMILLRVRLHDPGPVFAVGLLLTVLLLALTRMLKFGALPIVGLLSTLALEYSGLASPFHSPALALTLDWALVFYGVYTCFPFIFRRAFADDGMTWLASALAGPLHFYLIHDVATSLFPRMPAGLQPGLLALPSMLGFAFLARKQPGGKPASQTQLALFGGAALFFITLIFPLQFHHEWITISWALEGAALCLLFRKVPHPGLRLLGVALMTVAFIRLGCNPAILGYHARPPHPIFNWYLYAFGVVSLCLFAGARLLARPRNLAAGVNVPPLLYSMAVLLLFMLLNIEIADYFSAPGSPVLTFEFSGNFARDMSYSISWALFALMLLIAGIRNRTRGVRYASLSLLGITILKLFLHDLSELDQLYRIAAFIAVAIIAIFASFLYQRFLAAPASGAES